SGRIGPGAVPGTGPLDRLRAGGAGVTAAQPLLAACAAGCARQRAAAGRHFAALSEPAGRGDCADADGSDGAVSGDDIYLPDCTRVDGASLCICVAHPGAACGVAHATCAEEGG